VLLGIAHQIFAQLQRDIVLNSRLLQQPNEFRNLHKPIVKCSLSHATFDCLDGCLLLYQQYQLLKVESDPSFIEAVSEVTTEELLEVQWVIKLPCKEVELPLGQGRVSQSQQLHKLFFRNMLFLK
jgi:hypothetical protein